MKRMMALTMLVFVAMLTASCKATTSPSLNTTAPKFNKDDLVPGRQYTWTGRISDQKLFEKSLVLVHSEVDGEGNRLDILATLEGVTLPGIGTEITFDGVLNPGVISGTDYKYEADGSRTATTSKYLTLKEGHILSSRSSVNAPASESSPASSVENKPALNGSLDKVAPNPNEELRTVSGGVLNGKAISLPKPIYPNSAERSAVAGQVRVEVVIDEQGIVISAVAVSGPPALRPAAVAAARQAKFSRTLLVGKPVKVKGILFYDFAAPPK